MYVRLLLSGLDVMWCCVAAFFCWIFGIQEDAAEAERRRNEVRAGWDARAHMCTHRGIVLSGCLL